MKQPGGRCVGGPHYGVGDCRQGSGLRVAGRERSPWEDGQEVRRREKVNERERKRRVLRRRGLARVEESWSEGLEAICTTSPVVQYC